MEGEIGWDLLRSEGAGVFLFVQELDPAYSDFIVVEVEFLGVIDGVAEFDPLADIGRWDLIEGALEADGCVVVDYPLVTDEENLIEFGLG